MTMHCESFTQRSKAKPLDMRLALGIPLLLMLLLAVFEPVNLDLKIADMMYQPDIGFIGHKSAFLENILHDRVKQVGIALSLAVLLSWLASVVFPERVRIDRKRWLCVALSMGLASGIIVPLKRITEVQCPWNLTRYGGTETYSSVMSKRPPVVEKPGLCWPGGHASTGFSLFALFFALRDIKPRAAKAALAGTIIIGSILSFGRMLQGAHFLSHNLWTALIDWTICAMFYRLMLYQHTAATTMVTIDENR